MPVAAKHWTWLTLLAPLCLSACLGADSRGRTPHVGPASPSPDCSSRPLSRGLGGAGLGPLTIKLDHPTYHRIPTSVARPAKETVVFGAPPNVHIVRAEAVVVRRGVDIGHGPYARHISMLRDVPAAGQHVQVTLPATDANGQPLPPGQYLWGVLADFVLTGQCPSDRALGQQQAGAEMPFLVVRPR